MNNEKLILTFNYAMIINKGGDLIHCLKNFVTTENMECDFSEFGFVNF